MIIVADHRLKTERTNNMATCRECLHFGICKKGFPWADGKGGGWCEDFKSESDYVKRGEWVLETNSSVVDHGMAPFHDYALQISITATCSECGHKHHMGSSYEYTRCVFPPRSEKPNQIFECDEKLEEQNMLRNFKKEYKLHNFCPDCGADNRKEQI